MLVETPFDLQFTVELEGIPMQRASEDRVQYSVGGSAHTRCFLWKLGREQCGRVGQNSQHRT